MPPNLIEMPRRDGGEPTDLLFTYGTLCRGQSRNYILETEVFKGEAYIAQAHLWDTGYGFPALTLSAEGDQVWGEVYQIIHRQLWADLDRIENGLYDRSIHKVIIPGSRGVLAQVYIAGSALMAGKLAPIPSGRWSSANTPSN